MTRVDSLTKEVRSYDRDLFCKEEAGVILLCRKRTVWECHDFGFQDKLLYSRQVPEVIFALTDNFTQKGKPIDIGIEPLMNRIKSIDGWNDFNDSKNVADDLIKAKETADKHKVSEINAFAREWHPEFKKAFKDVNTSNLEKIDKRRNNKWL